MTNPQARFGFLAAVLAVLAAHPAAGQNIADAVLEGRILSATAAEQIETSLTANPRDLNARARLLGYYSMRAGQDATARASRLRQVEWLVKNEPASMLLRDPAARLQPSDFTGALTANLQILRAAWREQVDRHPDDVVLIENAANSTASMEGLAGGEKIVPYLKRLRELEPGDPEWAIDLALVYGTTLPRGMAPSAPTDVKAFATAIQAELEKSRDVAVIGLTGAAVNLAGRMQPNQAANAQAMAPLFKVSESLLRRAATLNPANPSWVRALTASAPSNSADLGTTLTGMLQESDLWPGGAVVTSIPPTAIRMSAETEASRRPRIAVDLPQSAYGKDCSVEFSAFIGQDGRIKTLQVVAFEHLNVPFISAERDALRQIQYPPMLVNGEPAEVITKIDVTCPKQNLLQPTIIGGVPGGVAGGIPGGVIGGLGAAPPPPPPPPPPPVRSVDQTNAPGPQRVGRGVQAAKLLKQTPPAYPPIAKAARIQGQVVLEVILGKDGTVQRLKMISATSPLLVQSAMDAVRQWVYQPTNVNGEPVEVLTEIAVNFTLQ